MVTKPKIDITKPKTFLIAKKLESMINALQHEQWRAPMTNKFITLIKNRTWTLIHFPKGKKTIGHKWAFKEKDNPNGKQTCTKLGL